jgi:uncharacterized membrane protein YqjE
MSYTGDMRSIWWLALVLIGFGLVTVGGAVHALRPYYRLLAAGVGVGVIVVAILGAVLTSKSGSLDDD